MVHCTLDHDCVLTVMTSPSPAQKTHHHPRVECSVPSHGSGASLLLNHDETWSEVWRQMNGSSVALRCAGRKALEPQTAGSTASVRTVVLRAGGEGGQGDRAGPCLTCRRPRVRTVCCASLPRNRNRGNHPQAPSVKRWSLLSSVTDRNGATSDGATSKRSTLVCSRWKDGPWPWRVNDSSSSMGSPCCVVKSAEATGTDRGSGELDTHHRHEGDWQGRPLQRRSHQGSATGR